MVCSVHPKTSGKSYELPQIVVILSSCLASVGTGMSFAWTSPAIPQLIADKERNISLTDVSYFTMLSALSMFVTAPLVAFIIEVFGRRAAVLFIAVPQLLGWIAIALSDNIWIFYINRILDGMVSATFYAALPIYIAEIAQPKVRDVWGNVTAVSCFFGEFLINVIGAYNNVQRTAIICCIFPILHVVIFWIMPESPYYLLLKDKEQEARKSLEKLRWTTNVGEELEMLKKDVQRQMSETGTIKDLFVIDSNRKAILMCILLRVAQFMSGISAFETYTQYMFQQAGGAISEKISSIVFTGALTVCAFASSYVIKVLRRRVLLMFSCFGTGSVLGIVSLYFVIEQFCTLNMSGLKWLPLAGMLLFLVTFSAGLGTAPILLLGELFSVSIKGRAISVMNIVSGTGRLIVPKLFQTLIYNFGMFAPFLLFSCSCFVSGILAYFYVIETKGKTLEEIQQELKRRDSNK